MSTGLCAKNRNTVWRYHATIAKSCKHTNILCTRWETHHVVIEADVVEPERFLGKHPKISIKRKWESPRNDDIMAVSFAEIPKTWILLLKLQEVGTIDTS